MFRESRFFMLVGDWKLFHVRFMYLSAGCPTTITQSCYYFCEKKSYVHIIFDRVLYIPVVQGFFYQQHLMKLV